MANRKTHCIKGHEYTEENSEYSTGHRRCRECKKLRERLRYRKDETFRKKKLAYRARWWRENKHALTGPVQG